MSRFVNSNTSVIGYTALITMLNIPNCCRSSEPYYHCYLSLIIKFSQTSKTCWPARLLSFMTGMVGSHTGLPVLVSQKHIKDSIPRFTKHRDRQKYELLKSQFFLSLTCRSPWNTSCITSLRITRPSPLQHVPSV